METGDGWLLRVRLPGGVAAPAALRAVADVVARYGSGIVELTGRANLQLRGFRADILATAAAALVSAGLATSDPFTDALRAIAASPLTGHDPTARADAAPIVEAIEAALLASSVTAVPSKFAVVVDDGGSWPLRLGADVRFDFRSDGRWAVGVRGSDRSIGVTDDPAAVAVAAAEVCADHGELMDAVGRDLGPIGVARQLGVGSYDEAEPAGPIERLDRRTVGVHPHPDPARGNVVATPFLGHLDAVTLVALAALVERVGASARIAPERSLALCGISRWDLDEVLAAMVELGLTMDAAQPAALLSACVGSRGCSSAYADTWREATQRAGVALSTRLHLSGCAKGCGAPMGVRHLIADASGSFSEAVSP
jgi:precorrin-3B synthase